MSVQIEQNTFVGEEKVCKLTGQVFHSYLGIPYAKPPVGNLRFQPPQELDEDTFEEEFDATVEGDDCVQFNIIKNAIIGDEDCLYLNVYVPKSDDDETLKPVMVFVHGGSFTCLSGSPANFSPDYLMSHGIIVVTINYRLHILGFMDLELPECPGNMGILDQMMAFQWVKKNIKYFGGDSENITAFGVSSGACIVHLLSISPLTKDLKLFNKMILISGNAHIVPINKVKSVDLAFELGHRLGYRGRNREHLLKFFKSLPVEDLTEAMHAHYVEVKTAHRGNVMLNIFSPTVQKCIENAIIPEDPREMCKKAKKVPILTGLMNKEGLLAYFLDPYLLNHLVENFDTVVQDLVPIINFDILPTAVRQIKGEYFQAKDITFASFPQTVDFFTDIHWTRRFYDILPDEESSENGPVYIFQFCYDGALNCYKKYYPVLIRWLEGATHDDILGYCLPFKVDLASKFSNKKDVKVINHVCTMFSNFIKTGNPNEESTKLKWKSSTQKEACYLQITDTLKLMPNKINEKRVEFWKQLEQLIYETEELKSYTSQRCSDTEEEDTE